MQALILRVEGKPSKPSNAATAVTFFPVCLVEKTNSNEARPAVIWDQKMVPLIESKSPVCQLEGLQQEILSHHRKTEVEIGLLRLWEPTTYHR